MGFLKSLLDSVRSPSHSAYDYLKSVVTGGFYRVSDIRSQSSWSDIRTLITTMRALAEDSQVATALSYYATDATTPNTSGQIIWATDRDDRVKCADVVNALFDRWRVNLYARDHILELATVGNLYIPTTNFSRRASDSGSSSKMYVGLDHHDVPDSDFDILPSHMIDPQNIVHIWKDYSPFGYVYDPDNTSSYTGDVAAVLPETSVVHFSLGGVIGKYFIEARDNSGELVQYDVQFAKPLMQSAVQPTQTLNLLEDATVLSSLIKVVRFVGIDCGKAEEDEVTDTLLSMKNIIEQQLSVNTSSGDAQSFINPQSPNNLIYLPKVDGNMPIEILDLNMKEDSEVSDSLLEYYQNKKLSVLGIPKEAMNFSSSEGLGGAGSVMSQRSALYANALQRIETAYMEGWRDAVNKYFSMRNLDRYVDAFSLHMNPILTEMSSVQFEKRDSAIGQASSLVDLLKSLGVTDDSDFKCALTETLSEAFPQISSGVSSWDMDVSGDQDLSDGLGGM